LDKLNEFVFIIGAAKCATTSLSEIINQSNSVCLSDPKESDFFTDRVNQIKDLDWYMSLFKKCEHAPIKLDASVSYSIGWNNSSKSTAERIYNFSNDAKIIYILRDPIERTWASYWHDARNGKSKGSFLNSLSDTSHHITASKYDDRIEDYLCYFQRENILLLDYFRLREDFFGVLKDVFDFLGMDKTEIQVLSNVNKNSSYKFNFLGNFILKFIKIKWIKYFVKILGGDRLNQIIKSLITSPVPKPSQEEIEVLIGIFKDDIDVVYRKYGINLRRSKYWDALDH
jgi:hypothetical protein